MGVVAGGEILDALVGGEFGGRGGAEIEIHAVEEALVLFDVRVAESGEGFLFGGDDGFCCELVRVAGDIFVALVAGGCGYEERGGIGCVYADG